MGDGWLPITLTVDREMENAGNVNHGWRLSRIFYFKFNIKNCIKC